MVAGLLLTALAQLGPCGPDGPIFCAGGSPARAGFEFAPLDGAGMGTACAGTVPTGAKGETMTSFARTSSATCSKRGVATTNIATGDLVMLSSGQPRVEPDPGGHLKLRVENLGTNLALQTQAFNNAAWTVASSGSVDPVVTADFANGPCGTPNGTTCFAAERLQFGACPSSGNISIIFQTGLGASGVHAGSVYCMGTSVSQTLSVCAFDDGANSGNCMQLTCPASSWSRATKTRDVAATTGGLVIGCNNGANYLGGGSTGTADVLLWGGDYEAGPYATSYVTTTTVAVTRAIETPVFPGVTSIASAGSSAATVVPLAWVAPDGLNHFVLMTPGGPARFLYAPTASAVNFFDGTNAPTSLSVTWTGSTAKRIYSSWTGVVATAGSTTDATSNTGNFTAPLDTTDLHVGSSGSEAVDALVGEICLDPSPTRCR